MNVKGFYIFFLEEGLYVNILGKGDVGRRLRPEVGNVAILGFPMRGVLYVPVHHEICNAIYTNTAIVVL